MGKATAWNALGQTQTAIPCCYRGERSGLNTDGSYVDITTPVYSFGDVLCGTYTRLASVMLASIYRVYTNRTSLCHIHGRYKRILLE